PLDFREIIIAFFLGFLIMGVTTNFFIDIVISIIRRKRDNMVYTLVAGAGNLAGHVENHINSNLDKQHRIRGFVKSKKETAVVGKEKVIGKLKDMDQYLHENRVDEII